MTSGHNSHFMDARSTMRMYKHCYTEAFAKRRAALGLGREAKGCLVFDGFAGNEAQCDGTHIDRSMWCEENNVTTICLAPHSSAETQPCDCVHAYFRALCDSYEEWCCGYDENPTKRRTLMEPRPSLARAFSFSLHLSSCLSPSYIYLPSTTSHQTRGIYIYIYRSVYMPIYVFVYNTNTYIFEYE